MLKLRQQFNSGEKLGSELFLCGPLYTAEGGHGTEYSKRIPQIARAGFDAQFLRIPKTPEEARQQVDDLAAKGVNAIKGILEAGVPGYAFKRMNLDLLRAVVDEAHAKKLPASIHTGESRDVMDAVALGADSIEHGSFRDEIPDATIAEMAAKDIAFDPTLSVVEGFTDFSKGKTDLLKRSLVQQVATKELLTGTEHAAASDEMKSFREGLGRYPMSVDLGSRNLLKAWRAGVLLVTGPTRQLPRLPWPDGATRDRVVVAGILPEVALGRDLQRGQTVARRRSHRHDRKGKRGNAVIVDGNPLQDVRAPFRFGRAAERRAWRAPRSEQK